MAFSYAGPCTRGLMAQGNTQKKKKKKRNKSPSWKQIWLCGMRSCWLSAASHPFAPQGYKKMSHGNGLSCSCLMQRLLFPPRQSRYCCLTKNSHSYSPKSFHKLLILLAGCQFASSALTYFVVTKFIHLFLSGSLRFRRPFKYLVSYSQPEGVLLR